MTTVEPGASEVFTHGLRARPRSTALRASRPAAIITLGFEVLVQLVIAAITTRPWSSSKLSPSSVTSIASSLPGAATAEPVSAGRGLPRSSSCSSAGGSEAGKDSSIASSRPLPICSAASGSNSPIAPRKACLAWERGTRSCGRFGPAMLGSTSPRSSSSSSEKTGSSLLPSWNIPCSRA